MTKKDVLEIRHLFAPKECSISKIRGCYVDGDCNMNWRKSFANRISLVPLLLAT